jgi:hypothetical protein
MHFVSTGHRIQEVPLYQNKKHDNDGQVVRATAKKNDEMCVGKSDSSGNICGVDGV